MISLDDLDQAMRDPARGVPAIRRLGGGSLAVTASGDPWRIVGRAAVIYALRRPTGRILALRVPLDDDPSALGRLGDRYRALATDPALAPLRAAGGPLPGEIRWLPDAITLPAAGFRSVSHPLLAMEFVAGGTLAEAVEGSAASGSPETVAAVTASLVRALVAFERAGFGHGDLRPDNILLRGPDDLAFVDLDRSAWKGSPGLPPGADPPARDRLAALLLLTELLALADRPDLQGTETKAEGRLLFGRDDLADPSGSPLIRRLRESEHRALAVAAALASDALAAGGTGAPPFGAVVDATGLAPASAPRSRGLAATGVAPSPTVPSPPAAGSPVAGAHPGWRPRSTAPSPETPRDPPDAGRGSSVAPPPPAPAASGAPPPRDTAPRPLSAGERQKAITRLNALLLAADTGAAGRFWVESGLAGDPEAVRGVGPLLRTLGMPWAPDPVAGLRGPDDPSPVPVTTAAVGGEQAPPAAVVALERLLPALEAGDVGLVARYWPEARRAPRAGFLAARVDAVLSRDLANRVRRAERLGDDAALAGLPAEAAAVGVALPEETMRGARAARDRAARRARLTQAMADGDRTALAELALSGIDDLGRLAPDAMKATERALAWPALERALADDDDVAIVAAADPALFADDPLLPPATRSRIELAYARVAWLKSARDALRHRDGSALRRALAAIPPGAEAGLSPTERRRIDRLARADAALARLGEALRAGQDAAIVDALAAVEETGAALPETLDWTVIQNVADRVALVGALRDVAEGDPADALRLARLLPAARALLAGPDSAVQGFDVDLEGLERRVLRAAHLARLRDALGSGDPAEIAAAAWPDPYGAIDLLTDDERSVVQPVA